MKILKADFLSLINFEIDLVSSVDELSANADKFRNKIVGIDAGAGVRRVGQDLTHPAALIAGDHHHHPIRAADLLIATPFRRGHGRHHRAGPSVAGRVASAAFTEG